MSETNPHNPEQPKKIRSDYLDKSSQVNDISGMALDLSLLSTSLFTAGNHTPELALAAGIISLGSFVKSARDTMQEGKIAIRNFVDGDRDLQFGAYQLVYQGPDRDLDGIPVKKGDNFFNLALPDITKPLAPVSSTETLSLWGDLVTYAIADLKDKIKPFDYSFVTITAPKTESEIPEQFQGKHFSTEKELMKGKHLGTIDGKTPVLILTKQEFEEAARMPNEVFQIVCEGIGDITVTQLFSELKADPTPEKKGALIRYLRIALNRQLAQEPTKSIAGSGNLYINGPPSKRVVDGFSQLVASGNGKYYLQTYKENGAIDEIPLDKKLRLDSHSVDEILASRLNMRSPQLLLTALQMLEGNELEALLQSNVMTKESLLARLQNFKAPKMLPIHVKDNFAASRSAVHLERHIRPALATLVLAAALHAGVSYHKHQEASNASTPSSVSRLQIEKPGFSEGVPKQSLEWKVIFDGKLNPNGYYITDTSHQMQKGAWVINKDVARATTYPTQLIDLETPHVTLEKVIDVQRLPDKRLKVPLLTGTNISALRITDIHGKGVRYLARIFTDNTVEIEFLGDVTTATVATVLTENSEMSVFAPAPIAPIDSTKLKTEINFELSELSKNTTIDAPHAIANMVRDKHIYSINPAPKYRDTINNATSGEELVNTAELNLDVNCNIAGSDAALMSSLFPGNPYVNIAIGFVYNTGNLDSGEPSNFLNGQNYHLFEIANNHEKIDATPIVAATDPQTQQYVSQLQQASLSTQLQQDELQWQTQNSKITSDARSQEDFKKSLGILEGIAGGVAGLVAIRQASRYLKRVVTRKNIGETSEKTFLSLFSYNDLSLADSFFNSFSWGNPTSHSEMPKNSLVKGKTKKELLANLKSNARADALELYLLNPSEFEYNGTSSKDRTRFRLLAQYLIRQKTEN